MKDRSRLREQKGRGGRFLPKLLLDGGTMGRFRGVELLEAGGLEESGLRRRRRVREGWGNGGWKVRLERTLKLVQ